MATVLTVDASVFVAAYQARETACGVCRDLLRLVREADAPLIEPAILPVEIAAALARAGESPAWATEYAESILAFPYLSLRPVDEHLAHRALAVATHGRLRGADALYVTVAAQYGARLVTLDAEQLRRAPATVRACQPAAAVAVVKKG